MQVFSRLDYDPREADRRRGDVVILESLQCPCGGLLLGQNRVRRRKYLVEVVCADELLQHSDVRVVRLIQSKALRERLEQTSVGVLRVLKHRRVGFERDVDRCHGILLRDGSLGEAEH